MGYIHCCGALRRTRTFRLVPPQNYEIAEVDFLDKCPVCGHKVIQLTKINKAGDIRTIRKTNKKADKFWTKLQNTILYEIKPYKYEAKGNFYLNYNEYGVIKRCYSNLRNLKLGKTGNLEDELELTPKLLF